MNETTNRGHADLDEAVDHAERTLHETAGHVRERGHEMADDVNERAHDARDRIHDGARALRDHAADAYDDARDWASDARDRHLSRASAVERFVTENPLLVGVVGVAAGLLLGALLPRTRREDEAVGPWADEVRDQGFRYAREFTSKGREFVETALDPDTLAATAERVAGAGDERRPHSHG